MTLRKHKPNYIGHETPPTTIVSGSTSVQFRRMRRQRASALSVQETEGGGDYPAVAAVATFKALIY